jgi:hypothetical protein
MNTAHVDLSLEQLKQALRQLPAKEKIAVWRMLNSDLDREVIARRFTSTVNAVRKAYADLSEDEVMADAVKATRAVRHAKSRP